MSCLLCLKCSDSNICTKHNKLYTFDKEINGFRLKKRSRGSRYIKESFHKSEIELTRLIESYYGKQNVVTEFHPLWAIGSKGALLEYDILIKNKNILIEYSGKQHFEFIRYFTKSLKKFEDLKKRDELKKQLAKDNNYKLVIITYKEPIVLDYIINRIEKDL